MTSNINKTKTLTEKNEQFRHEEFCESIIDKDTWEKVQFLLSQRSEINPQNHIGHKLHWYAGIIKCADCGASLIARTRKFENREYVEYTCNNSHHYGNRYCAPHTIRECQLDKYVAKELRMWQATSLLKPSVTIRSSKTAEMLKSVLAQSRILDIACGCSSSRLDFIRKRIKASSLPST